MTFKTELTAIEKELTSSKVTWCFNTLHNWTTLNLALVHVEPTETETKRLLAYEVRNDARPSFVKKLHQRYAALRRAREQQELGYET